MAVNSVGGGAPAPQPTATSTSTQSSNVKDGDFQKSVGTEGTNAGGKGGSAGGAGPVVWNGQDVFEIGDDLLS